MMIRQTLEELVVLLDEVRELADNCIIDLDLRNELDVRGFKKETPSPPHPGDHITGGNMNTGALRRRSMDLSRKLSEMRRYE